MGSIDEHGLGFGFRVGHYTDAEAHTGCTVVLPPPGNVASCDIRGASPGSRELAQLHPDRRLTEIHGVLLTGGSAFGLAAADGVVSYLEEHGIGYETPVGVVPIVPAAVVFDLGTGAAETRPGPAAGRAACTAAAEAPVAIGAVGAGTGATVGKWAGFEYAAPGGVGIGRASEAGHEVSAMAVVNAVGDVVDDDARVVAGTTSPNPQRAAPRPRDVPTNTVLALVATRAAIDKRGARWLAARGSDGITVSVRPAHTPYDGDVVFAVAAPDPDARAEPRLDILGILAAQAVARAVRAAVTASR
jgi:L-aminopeptidase/D-esterase-like protein